VADVDPSFARVNPTFAKKHGWLGFDLSQRPAMTLRGKRGGRVVVVEQRPVTGGDGRSPTGVQGQIVGL
jgi:hypothetical protein